MVSYSLIAAISDNYVIANENGIPWDIEEDIEHYMSTVSGHTLVVGRKTFESMGRRNPGSQIVILSTQDDLDLESDDAYHAKNIDEAKNVLERITEDDEKIFVIGGEAVYDAFLKDADELIISHIDGEYNGVAHFPRFNQEDWTVVDEVVHDEFTVKWYNRDNT